MKRNKHSLSHYRLLTGEMGALIPIACFEALPGDSIQQATSLLVRLSPLVAPVMHPVTVRVHHWFVPHRLVWDGWEDFITGGPDGLGADTEYPVLSTGTGLDVGSLGDHLGIKPGVGSLEVSAFPLRSYIHIWNEFYRDQDLLDPVPLDTTALNSACFGIAWEKDYFTSARPWPQKGPDVSLPLGVSAPVVGTGVPSFKFSNGAATELASAAGSGNAVWSAGNAPAAGSMDWNDPKLSADLTQATAVNVNDMRLAFALQRYQEARARYGSRYTEYLRYLGVRSSDARLQRPEYLGGGKQTISFSEVLQTGPDTEDEGVGNLKGHGISAMRSRRYRRFFEEHGIVLSLLSVRPKTIYADAMSRLWYRRTKEDYWQKELEQIGQQEIDQGEMYPGAGVGAFGYQDRYAEYKHIQSTIHGDFRSTLNYWHLARQFSSQPTLNGSFVTCDPSKRIFAEQTTNPLLIMAAHSIQARRLVSRSASSRIM